MTNETPTTARRVLAPEYGGPEVLRVVDEDVVQPGPGQVLIAVRAVGLNPADYKGFSGQRSSDPDALPIKPGYEVAGVVAALGADTELASGGGAVGDEVLAFRVSGGYASAVTVPAKDVFAKPAALDFPAAANLLLAASTAADMLHAVEAKEGETILVHGASGAVGVSVLQLARDRGIRAIGTASERNFDIVRRFGGEPVAYGDGLQERARCGRPGRVRRRARLRRHRRGGRRLARARAEGALRDDRRLRSRAGGGLQGRRRLDAGERRLPRPHPAGPDRPRRRGQARGAGRPAPIRSSRPRRRSPSLPRATRAASSR